MIPKNPYGCPYLQLAPMEGVGDRSFRKAIASIGGFDEAVRDFIRVPKNAHIKSLADQYEPGELAPIPLAAQLMGSDPRTDGPYSAGDGREGGSPHRYQLRMPLQYRHRPRRRVELAERA